MFYPGDALGLRNEVGGLLANAAPGRAVPKALIAPHAGYVYSGAIAATAYASLDGARGTIERVVLLGPAHRVPLRGMAVPSVAGFRTPLGDVPLDRAAIAQIADLPHVAVSDAAHADEHVLEVHLPFLQSALGDFRLVPIVVGRADEDAVDAVLAALWGGPETLVVVSSDLSHYHGYDEARRRDRTAARAIETLAGGDLDDDGACGRYPIKGLLARAQALDLRATTLDLRNSGDTAGDRSRVVGYGSWAFDYARTARHTDDERAQLGHLAREAIAEGAKTGAAPSTDEDALPWPLRTTRASFVTVKRDGELRGCVGTLGATEPLAVDVRANAFKAAFADPRFEPTAAEDVGSLELSISILSTPRRIEAKSDAALAEALNPDVDGLVLVAGAKRGLFLPQVWSSVRDPRTFVRLLKEKAGIGPSFWPREVRAYRFSTETFAA